MKDHKTQLQSIIFMRLSLFYICKIYIYSIKIYIYSISITNFNEKLIPDCNARQQEIQNHIFLLEKLFYFNGHHD